MKKLNIFFACLVVIIINHANGTTLFEAARKGNILEFNAAIETKLPDLRDINSAFTEAACFGKTNIMEYIHRLHKKIPSTIPLPNTFGISAALSRSATYGHANVVSCIANLHQNNPALLSPSQSSINVAFSHAAQNGHDDYIRALKTHFHDLYVAIPQRTAQKIYNDIVESKKGQRPESVVKLDYILKTYFHIDTHGAIDLVR